jgi:hypothetical protein
MKPSFLIRVLPKTVPEEFKENQHRECIVAFIKFPSLHNGRFLYIIIHTADNHMLAFRRWHRSGKRRMSNLIRIPLKEAYRYITGKEQEYHTFHYIHVRGEIIDKEIWKKIDEYIFVDEI